MTDEGFETLRANGIKVNYGAVCHRKVWLYVKGLGMELFSDRVALGCLLHECAYPDPPRNLYRRAGRSSILANPSTLPDHKSLITCSTSNASAPANLLANCVSLKNAEENKSA